MPFRRFQFIKQELNLIDLLHKWVGFLHNFNITEDYSRKFFKFKINARCGKKINRISPIIMLNFYFNPYPDRRKSTLQLIKWLYGIK